MPDGRSEPTTASAVGVRCPQWPSDAAASGDVEAAGYEQGIDNKNGLDLYTVRHVSYRQYNHVALRPERIVRPLQHAGCLRDAPYRPLLERPPAGTARLWWHLRLPRPYWLRLWTWQDLRERSKSLRTSLLPHLRGPRGSGAIPRTWAGWNRNS